MGEVLYDYASDNDEIKLFLIGDLRSTRLLKFIFVLFLSLIVILVSTMLGIIINVLILTFGIFLFIIALYILIFDIIIYYILNNEFNPNNIQISFRVDNIKELISIKSKITYIIDGNKNYYPVKIDKFSKRAITEIIKVKPGQSISLVVNQDKISKKWIFILPNLNQFNHLIKIIEFYLDTTKNK